MALEQKKNRQNEKGFTLAFTIMLTVVLSLAAVAIMTKVFISTRQAGFNKEHQNTMDAAVIGLNMAIDELSPGMDRMRNTVWTSAVTPIPLTYPGQDPYPKIAYTQSQMKSNGATSDYPVRELSLVGNIRNWEAFANWGGTTTAQWNRGWEYVPNSATLQYFDASPGQTGNAPVAIGTQKLTGAYWYSQIDPKPPTLADGAPDVPVRSNGTKLWPNTRGGIYGNEYPDGIFWQPVLRKVYQVRQNPLVRVAVYVRMSLQDYYGVETRNGQIVYANRHLDGRTFPDSEAGMDTASASYDGRNLLETNAISFSVFAVSEGTPDSKGVRIHQALNVTLGGAEYISGRSSRQSIGSDINLNGLENPGRLYKDNPGGKSAYVNYLTPYFAPSLDTPSGNSQLTAYAPMTGQVYPASGDLTLNFSTHPATEQAVFLYEHIKLANPSNGLIVFLIEQVPPGVAGPNRYWRRRLLYDYPAGYSPSLWDDGVTPDKSRLPMVFNPASFTIDPWTDTAGFPSMLRWGNVDPVTFAAQNCVPKADFKENYYYITTGTMFGATAFRYPYTAQLDRFGTFMIGTQSAGDFGVPAGDSRGDVVTWPANPLVDYRGGRLAASMPWQGPTIPYSQAVASVSYVTTAWPMRAYSTIWNSNGGGVGIPFTAATWSVY